MGRKDVAHARGAPGRVRSNLLVISLTGSWIRVFPRHGNIDAHRFHETIACLKETELITTDQRQAGVIIEQHDQAVAPSACEERAAL